MSHHAKHTNHIPWLSILLLAACALRVIYFTADRFHADEALYAGWALRALDGDPFLLGVPVDKPPLYLYTLAASLSILGRSEVAARLPNLAASLIGIALLYQVERHLYGAKTARWAAFFFALAPFDILFARTAFTDPMLIMWALLALYALLTGRAWIAGMAAGLAFATKQHALLLLPLLLPVEIARAGRWRPSRARSLAMLGGLSIPLALTTWWDARRWYVRPGYWRQSAMSYGGLRWAPYDRWLPRLIEWNHWLRYLGGSWPLYLVLVIGSVLLVITAWRRRASPHARIDIALVSSASAYLAAHTLFQFSIWDRYLLPLAPLAALLLARILLRARAWLHRASPGPLLRLVWTLALCYAAIWGGVNAALNGYPIGGEHWAYQGIDHIAAYLEQHAAPDAVLYHHWLRWHYSYYLYGSDIELRWWASGEHLEREALRTLDREQYIVLPDWRTVEPAAAGIELQLLYETHRRDGTTSLRLYRIQPKRISCPPSAGSYG
jgi:4-amino-4-deoxy-L-arabinose transferase-like glycosyltransferase